MTDTIIDLLRERADCNARAAAIITSGLNFISYGQLLDTSDVVYLVQ